MEKMIKVLAVDDEKFNLLLLKSCLKGEKYELTTCENALQTLNEFKKKEFDVILLDILMAGINGFEVRKLIREINKEVPIIFLTSMVDDINSTLLNQLADDQYSYYMNKSFNKTTLMKKIDQAVSVYRELHATNLYYQQLEDNLTLAGDVQKILLPSWCSLSSQMLVSYLYMPAMKVSGDMLELIRLDEYRTLFFIGDIAGHGVQAALYMSAVQSFLKALLFMGAGTVAPHTILNGIENFFRNDLGSKNYMTCTVAIFDFKKNHLSFQSAGHPNTICCFPDKGEAHFIDLKNKGGLPVGLARENHYRPEDTVEFDFQDNSAFVIYTDGILDLNNSAGDSVDDDTFLSLLGPLSRESDVVSVPFRIRYALEQIGYDIVSDDICIAVIQKQIKQEREMQQVIAADTAEVTPCVVLFSRFVSELFSSELATKVEMLLSEFLNNVIVHGLESRRHTHTDIFIRLTALDKGVRIRVMDRSKEWQCNPALYSSTEELLDRQNAERATSGRGLPIIYSIASSITRNHYFGLNETIFIINTK